ncbi:MAG TPA: hypothetical protein V6C99_08170 [Oculatellaceae cyanobacterium]|jgi:hypothetical protein
MSRYTAILYDTEDVNRFYAENPEGIGQILPLTPSAQAVLLQETRPVLDPSRIHTNFGQLRDVVRCNRLEEFLEQALIRDKRLSAASAQAVVDYALHACGVSSRIWGILSTTQAWALPQPNGWLRSDSREEVHQILTQQFLDFYNQDPVFEQIGTTSWKDWLKLFYYNTRLALKLSRTRPLFFNSLARGFAKLAEALESKDPNLPLILFNPLACTPGALNHVKSQYRLLRKGQPLSARPLALTIPPARRPRQAAYTKALLEAIPDPIARTGALCMAPAIINNVEWVESILPLYKWYLRLTKARAVLNWDIADRFNATLALAAKESKIPALLFCHTTMTPGYTAASVAAKQRRTKALGASPLADITYVQSVAAEAAAQQFQPKLTRVRVQPVVWGHTPATAKLPPTHEKIILHASNYFYWSAYQPWVYETGNDFVQNLIELLEAARGISDVRVIIRIKPRYRPEFDEATLRKLLPMDVPWEISQAETFNEDLERTHLVTAFHSATIEEALLARKPVLLLGCGGRYLHLKADSQLPDAHRRSAVYAPSNPEQLPTLLAAILNAHSDRLLTDEETAPYLWPAETPGISELADALIKERFQELEKPSVSVRKQAAQDTHPPSLVPV